VGARPFAGRGGASIPQYNWTTKSKRRTAEHIVHAVDIAHVMRAFFTDQATLLANDPLGPIWINGKRETTSLLD
jgi:hypothetical protein